jgi:hypothetical protein
LSDINSSISNIKQSITNINSSISSLDAKIEDSSEFNASVYVLKDSYLESEKLHA